MITVREGNNFLETWPVCVYPTLALLHIAISTLYNQKKIESGVHRHSLSICISLTTEIYERPRHGKESSSSSMTLSRQRCTVLQFCFLTTWRRDKHGA